MTATATAPAEYGVVVTSIGSAGASVVAALRHITKISEQVLALRLFQTPSLLFKDLPRELADDAAGALRGAGLEVEVRHRDLPFTPGDAEHEVALVIHDHAQMPAVLQAVAALLGVDLAQARRIVCSSPAVLMGRISRATAEAVRRRFAPLGVEVDISRPTTARFDAFIGECSPAARHQLRQLISGLGIAMQPGDEPSPLLAADLSRRDADRLFSHAARSKQPLIVLNRDFERFDLRLDAAPASPAMLEFLVETAGMPARVAPKVLARLPMVTHTNLGFADLGRHMSTIAGLGGRASGHLLAFQSFSLAIETIADPPAAAALLRGVGGLTAEQTSAALGPARQVPGPLTGPLARWLAHELKQVGTTTRMVLR